MAASLLGREQITGICHHQPRRNGQVGCDRGHEKIGLGRRDFGCHIVELYTDARSMFQFSTLALDKCKADDQEKGWEEEMENPGIRNIGFGLLWLIGGGLFTAITYSAASSGGGTYVVAIGAIVGGAIQFLVGLFQFLGSR